MGYSAQGLEVLQFFSLTYILFSLSIPFTWSCGDVTLLFIILLIFSLLVLICSLYKHYPLSYYVPLILDHMSPQLSLMMAMCPLSSIMFYCLPFLFCSLHCLVCAWSLLCALHQQQVLDSAQSSVVQRHVEFWGSLGIPASNKRLSGRQDLRQGQGWSEASKEWDSSMLVLHRSRIQLLYRKTSI